MIGDSSIPLAYLLAGPLADGVFEPLMRTDGALADSVGRVIGTGEGRGTALVFAVTGALMVLIVALGWSRRPLREVDRLPDALPASTPAPTKGESAGAAGADESTESAEPVRG